MKNAYTLLLTVSLFLGSTAAGFGQNKSVTGIVTDGSTGNSLPGVNILVKGTSSGTSSNNEGQYSLSVSSLQDTLVFSYVGYQSQKVPIKGRTNLDIEMQPQALQGEQMVVVGYQKKQRGEITGSIGSVNPQEIEEAGTPNIQQSLEGKIAGLVVSDRGGPPGNPDLNILIRGQATLGNNSPLYVINGVPRTEDDFAHLAPNDIESISVLKDASAAIYGARAANGVILVQTKQGQEGKAAFSFQAEYGLQTPTNIYSAMNSYQRAQYNYEASGYEGVQPFFTKEAIGHFKKGDEPLVYPNTNWFDEIGTKSAPQTHYNLSVQGGSENIQYFISGDLLNQQGLLKSGDLTYKQHQLRGNINAQPTKDIQLGLNVELREEKNRQPQVDSPFESYFEYPWIVARWPNGLLGPPTESLQNAITETDRKYGFYNENNHIINARFNLSYDMGWLTKGLQVSGYADFSRSYSDSRRFYNVWTMYSRDPNTEEYIPHQAFSRSHQGSRGVFSNSGNYAKNFYHLQLDYKKSFGKHNFSAFAAYEQSEAKWGTLGASRTGLPSASKPYLFAGIQAERTNSETVLESGRVNYFGSVSYNYARTYLVDFTLRDDGSFNFAPDRRFGLFPSVSAGWNIANEPFMNRSNNWLDNLKLRLSYGKMGNDNVPDFQYLATYNYENAYTLGISPTVQKGFFLNNSPNPNITWEVSRQYNIGLDLSVMEGLFSLSVDYFREKRRNILLSRAAAIPTYTGLTLPDENFGKVNNKGIELHLTHQNTVGPVSYNVSGNFTYTQNDIIDKAEPKNTPEWQKQQGHPIGSFLVYKSNGIYHTQEEVDNSVHLAGSIPGDINYQDVDGDGKITGNDQVRVYSSIIPKIQYGLNGTINYKHLQLSLFFQGQLDATSEFSFGDNHTLETLFTKRWTPDNKDADFPRAFLRDDSHNRRDSQFWLRDASFLRLKSATIAYNFPTAWFPGSGISNLRVYIRGRNLKTWDNMIGNYDPEKANGITPYPQIRRVKIGAKIDF